MLRLVRWLKTKDGEPIRVVDYPVDSAQPGDSRQVRRWKEFCAEFAEVSRLYGGEPRKARRKMARTILRRERSEAQQPERQAA